MIVNCILKDNLVFIQGFLTSKEKYFNIFYKNGDKVDKVMGEVGHSWYVVDANVYNSEITPLLVSNDKANSEPDWKQIERNILSKFDPKTASRATCFCQV